MNKMTVEVIPATKKPSELHTKKIKNVAAYCRVSTEAEEQLGSFDTQYTYYKNKILSTPGWKLAGMYGDEGISGVKAKNRPSFNQMIKDCENGKIDLILTKSVSRFARNLLDTISICRRLREKDIGIYFEKENLNTLNLNSEMLLALYAMFAQSESESISANVKNGKRMRYKAGNVGYNFNMVYGYKQDENKNINPDFEQATVVIFIFEEYLRGKSLQEICGLLKDQNRKSPGGKDEWKPEAVKRILTNEKYAGDVLTQKTFTSNVIDKKTIKNTGQITQYLVRDHHIPIIQREKFDMVQIEVKKRSCIRRNENKDEFMKYSGKFEFNNKIICGQCGTKYRRTMWITKKNEKQYKWRCLGRTNEGKQYCPNSPTIDDEFLKETMLAAINTVYNSKSRVKDIIKCTISTILGEKEQPLITENKARIEELNNELRKVIEKNSIGEISSDELDDRCAKIMDEIKKLREENKQYEIAQKLNNSETAKLKDIFKAVDEMREELTEYNPDLVRKIVERIEVHSKEKATIWFAGEIPYEINLPK